MSARRCETCVYKAKQESEYPCVSCSENAVDHYKMMTNGERIRQMSDKELAEFLENFKDCEHCAFSEKECCKKPCSSGIKKWIQSESEGRQ